MHKHIEIFQYLSASLCVSPAPPKAVPVRHRGTGTQKDKKDKARETKRYREKQREADRDREKQRRTARRDTGRHRETQRDTERHRR